MIIKNVQTLVFEYPEDYQAEIEWNKKRDGDWVHQSTDTICSVYTLTNNYLIPTKAKHSFVDNAYFEGESNSSEKPNDSDEPQTMAYPQVDGITPSVIITEDRDTQVLDSWQVKLQTERSE